MKKKATTLILLAVFAACEDTDRPTGPITGPDAAEAAVEFIMAELSDARTLEVSSRLHGQTIEERIDHLTGLLQWFTDQDDAGGNFDTDTLPDPRIDTVFTVVALDVSENPLNPSLPEMMAGKILVYTKANMPGAIAHVTKWHYDSYTDEFMIPEHLAHEHVDAAASDELMTVIGCFYLPNETGLPNERVDYWAIARSHHVYIVRRPGFPVYREDQWTEDFEDTRNPTPIDELLPCGLSGM